MRTKSLPRIAAGQRYGRLVAVRLVDTRHRRAHWLFKCDCGAETTVAATSARSGNTRSCGCFYSETRRAAATHGMSYSAEYRAWQDMIRRCSNPHAPEFENYGGRGISVCGRWRTFKTFLADVGPRPSRYHSLDRFPDNDGNYEPGNVRWALRQQQQRNMRSNLLVEYDGQKMPLADAAERAGLKYTTVKIRLYRGWTIERALSP